MNTLILVIIVLILLVVVLLISFSKFVSSGITGVSNIFVISLPNAIERKEHITKMMENVNFNYFTAVDGKNLSNTEIELKEKFINPDNTLKPGEIGCSLSHISLWYYINKNLNNEEYYIILEDDIVPQYPIQDIMGLIKETVKLGYDIIYLGSCFEKPGGEKVKEIEFNNNNFIINKPVYPLCSHAYVLTKQGLSKIIKHLDSGNVKLDRQIDVFLPGMISGGIITGIIFENPVIIQSYQDYTKDWGIYTSIQNG
jgi:GR25 family glycosyltransferase involved in LPS biosynthesis